jgi:hypothetical protein
VVPVAAIIATVGPASCDPGVLADPFDRQVANLGGLSGANLPVSAASHRLSAASRRFRQW